MSDFHGIDFALGEVFGIRAFKVDEYGRLRSVGVNAKPWRPGVNVAECVKAQNASPYSFGGLLWPSALPTSSYEAVPNPDGTFTLKSVAPPTEKPKDEYPHQAPVDSCKCGFYAYLDSHADDVRKHSGYDAVVGIVKAHGKVLMGSKGFRAEKAEIVALRAPTRGGRRNGYQAQRMEKLIARVYPDVPLLETKAALLEFAPLSESPVEIGTDDFWALP